MGDPSSRQTCVPWIRRAVCCLWLVAFGLLLFGTRLAFIHAYGNATPYWDQWNAEAELLYKPHLAGRLDWTAIVAPHVVHRIATARLLALGIFDVNGVWNPLLQMVVNAALWVVTIGTLVVLLDRATGRRHLPLLLAFALVACGLPHGHENMLAGFQSCFYFLVFWSTLALWALAVARPFSVGWWGGIGAVVLGFLSLGSGTFVAAAACAVAVAQYATGARRDRRQLAASGVLAALVVAGVLLTAIHATRDASTARLGARDAGQALTTLLAGLGWPLEFGPLGAVVVQWPALVLAVVLLRRPPPAADPRWFLLAAVAGTLGQATAIAYGRGAAGNLASRYLDLFAVGLLVDFACALAVFPEFSGRNAPRAVATLVAWVGIVLGAMAVHVERHAFAEMRLRRETAAAQQANTRAYVLTGDMRNLKGKPPLHVPFPFPDMLAGMLDDPVIRSFLPPVVAPPLPAASFTSEPATAFVAHAAGPAALARDEPTWSSHGTGGPEATGTAAIAFPGPHRGHAVAVPVAVGGDAGGITFEVEQDGARKPLPVPAATGSWTSVRVKVHRRPFTLHVADRSSTGWVAVAAPVAQGRFDARVDRLLCRWDQFILGGVVLTMALLVHGALTVPPAGRQSDPDVSA